MAYLEDFYDALREAVAAVWTDAKPNGIYEIEQQQMIPWANLTPPCAAILIPSMPVSDDWGMAWRAYEPRVEFYYVAAVTGDSGNIRAKLEALRDYLLTTGLTAGQVLEIDDLCWSDELEANQVMIQKDYAQRVGRVIAHCLVGETP